MAHEVVGALGMVRLDLSSPAEQVLQQLLRRHGRLYLIIGDTGCCGFSNILLTSKAPGDAYEYLGESGGVGVYVQRAFKSLLGRGEEVGIDAVPVESDDSFSLETGMGYRFILKAKPATGGETALREPRSSGVINKHPG